MVKKKGKSGRTSLQQKYKIKKRVSVERSGSSAGHLYFSKLSIVKSVRSEYCIILIVLLILS